jgi:hypothetical protein
LWENCFVIGGRILPGDGVLPCICDIGLSLQVAGVPEGCVVWIFAANDSDGGSNIQKAQAAVHSKII